MELDLLALSRQVEETFEDVEVSFGTVRVYHVPDPVVWSFKPEWTLPPPPVVEMKLANNQTQRRAAKAGDAGYIEWQAEQERYEAEKDDIQWSARFVLALRDAKYPADLSQPPAHLSDYINGNYPPESPADVRRKHFWLSVSVLAKSVDHAKIQAAMIRMNTGALPTAEGVDEVKKSSASTTEADASEPGA